MKKRIRFEKIILLIWIILGLIVLIFQEEPSKIEYGCVWVCFIAEKIGTISFLRKG